MLISNTSVARVCQDGQVSRSGQVEEDREEFSITGYIYGTSRIIWDSLFVEDPCSLLSPDRQDYYLGLPMYHCNMSANSRLFSELESDHNILSIIFNNAQQFS